MSGMHALHEILANCARPKRERATPGGTGKTLQGTPLPQIYRDMIDAGGEKPCLKRRLAGQAAG